MKRKFRRVVCLLSWAAALAVTNPASAQTTAPGPYYATPSWDQTLDCGATCPRFIVLSNMNGEAVLDRETGLVWERDLLRGRILAGIGDRSATSWEFAHDDCNSNVVAGNRMGWRLPTIQELASLVDPAGPFNFPAGHPFLNRNPFHVHWSATTDARNTGRAWKVQFSTPQAGIGPVPFGLAPQVFPQDKSDPAFYWCVRGGQGVDPQ